MYVIQKYYSSFFFTILFSLAAQGFSCIGNSNQGPIEKERRDVGSFSQIDVSDGIDVFLKQGSRILTEVETTSNSMQKLRTEVRGNVLHIFFDGPWSINRLSNVYITLKDIEQITASSGSDVVSDGVLSTPMLALKASGGSDIRIEVDVEDLEIECSGGSDVIITGSAGRLSARTSGGSDLKGFDLLADEADLESSGGSDIQVHVVERLRAEASGGSDIRYRGDPEIIIVESSSSADIKRAGN